METDNYPTLLIHSVTTGYKSRIGESHTMVAFEPWTPSPKIPDRYFQDFV
ncbi:hypothetical protein C943_01766 [Mariniradius saccharolyticus AK6]|uniref:Uncharacterized protein n=1 Tax=Mariniradius saccharolyticus AK6 TaxID=1239962 RepID=M7XTJ8_9BACT|nr:hypothetical protein C943_01766 [Mariniradius saccharolyticus AK6]